MKKSTKTLLSVMMAVGIMAGATGCKYGELKNMLFPDNGNTSTSTSTAPSTSTKPSTTPSASTSTSTPKPHEHTYASGWTSDATSHWHAAACEHTDQKAGVAAHTFGEWKVVKESTVTEEGSQERSCSVCKYVETGKIDKIPTVVATEPMKVADALLGIGGYEWGPAVDMLVFKVDGTISAGTLNKDMFQASTPGQSGGNTILNVTDAFLCNAKGIKVDGDSEYFAVKFQAKAGQLSPFTYGQMEGASNQANTWTKGNAPAVTVEMKEGNSISVLSSKALTKYSKFSFADPIDFAKRVSPSTDSLNKGTYTTADKSISLKWGAYETQDMKKDSGKNPLIIWLHGAGEGGDDVDIAWLGNDVTNLNEERIQEHFKTDKLAGAYVLAVQSPTMWMNNGTGAYTSDGKSMYLEALMDAIKNYAEKVNTDVDLNRIYIGGCSNGGYMTMNMMINYGDYFAAAYPICEAYSDAWITDAQIADLAKRNIWFTHSADDGTVNPSGATVATYLRLLKAGAKNTYFSFFESIIGEDDPTASQAWGQGKGNYMGHYSWIYTLQDKCERVQSTEAKAASDIKGSNANAGGTWNVQIDGKNVDLWTWMAAQTKGAAVGTAVADPELNKPVEPDPVDPVDPTPDTPSVPGEKVRIEAEDESVKRTEVEGASNPITVEENANCSNGKGIGYFSDAGKKLTFTYNAEKAGKAVIYFGLASCDFIMDGDWSSPDFGRAKPMTAAQVNEGTSVEINGKLVKLVGEKGLPQGEAMFNAWNVGVLSVEVDLVAGENTIVLTRLSAGAAVNVDYIEIETAGSSSETPENPGTPDKPTAGSSTIYEAEDAVIVGNTQNEDATFVEDAAAAHGGKVVGNLSAQGNTITFNVKAEKDGEAELKFYMTSTQLDMTVWGVVDQTVTTDMIEVKVNGTVIKFDAQKVPGSGGFTWNESFAPVSMKANLKAGDNTVVITVLGSTCPNIDYLEVITAGSSSETPENPGTPDKPVEGAGVRYEAENAVIKGATQNEDATFVEAAEAASGGQVVGNLSKAGNTITFTVKAEKDGAATLKFYMTSTQLDMTVWGVVDQTVTTSMIEVKVNGTVITFDAQKVPGSGGFTWNESFAPVSMSANLKAGDNTVVITVLGDTCPNIDYLEVIA